MGLRDPVFGMPMRSRRRFLFCLHWFSILLSSMLSVPAASGDMTINLVCLLSDSSAFPIESYDTLLRRVSNSTLVASTTARSDSITGAEAMQRYFADANVPFRRFELIHVTRVRSVVAGGGSAAVGRLRQGLKTLTVNVGMCGVGEILDSFASVPPSSDQQWFLSMPALVAPIALAGWGVTLLSCAVCWVCVCCTADRSVQTVAQVAVVESGGGAGPLPPVVAVAVPVATPSKVGKGPRGSKPFARGAGASGQAPSLFTDTASRVIFPAQHHPPLHPSIPIMPLNAAVEFHRHQHSHLLQLRIPSFAAPLGVTTT